MTTVQLDSGSSALPVAVSLRGASASGLLLAKGGGSSVSAALRPGSQQVTIPGGATTALPAAFTANGYQPTNGLIGGFAISQEYDPSTNSFSIAYHDGSTPTISGSKPVPGGVSIVSGGPHGWVSYTDSTNQLDYVQPTGGSGDPVTTTPLLTLGPQGTSYEVANGGANTQGVLISASCSGGCAPGTVLKFIPFADPSSVRVLSDASAAFAAPVPTGTTQHAPVSAFACPSGTTCMAIDGAGGLEIGDVGDPGSWTSSAIDAGNRLVDLSCPTSTLCVAVDDAGNRLYTTTPTSGGWSAPARVDQDGGLTALSCPTTTLCVAVDDLGQVLRTLSPTGPTSGWTATAVVTQGGFAALRCPSTSLCVAVDRGDFNGTVRSYTNTNPAASTTWTANTLLAGGPSATALACPDATRCYVTDDFGDVLHNTTASSFTSWTSAAVDNNVFYIAALSCASAVSCTLLDGSGNAWHTTAPTTGPWTSTATPIFGAFPTALLCGGTLCVAGANDGGVASSANSGGSFSTPAQITSPIRSPLMSVSCPSASSCFALDDHQGVAASSDGGGSWATPVSIPGSPSRLDCPTSTACIGVDQTGLATSSTTPSVDGSWTSVDTGDTNGLSGVDCRGTTLCVAFGSQEVIVSTNAFTGSPTWSAPHQLESGGAELTDLKCPSTTLCVAVDSNGALFTSTNPTAGTWSAGVTPTGSTGFTTLSCPTTTQCLAGSDDGTLFKSVNPTGGAAAWVGEGQLDNGLLSLSCPTTTLCVGIDFGNTQISTQPLAGAASFSPGPSGLGPRAHPTSLSCVSAARCVVGGSDGSSALATDVTKAVTADGADVAVDEAGDAAWVTTAGDTAAVRRMTTSSAAPVGTPIAATCASSVAVTPARTYWLDCDGALVRADGATTTTMTPSGSYVLGLATTGTTAFYSLQDGSVHSLADGSTTPATIDPAAGVEPVSARNVALSPGRVAYTDDAVSATANPTWSRSLSNVAGNLTAGAPSVVAHATSGPSLSISGTRTLVGDNASSNLTVSNGASTALVATSAQLGGLGQFGYRRTGPVVSGLRVLYPLFRSGAGLSWRLYDLTSGITTTPPGADGWVAASLSGQYLASMKANAEVDLLDLVTGTSTVVQAAPTLPAGTVIGDSPQVSVSGRSVAWLFDEFNASFNQTWSAGYVRNAGSATHPLTVDGGFSPQVRISHQYVVSSTNKGAGLAAIRLSDDASVPVSALTPGPASCCSELVMAVDGNLVGYQGADGTAKVEQLPAVSPDVPVVLGASTPGAYTTGSGRVWQAEVVTSAPLTTCSWAVTQGATAIRTLPCDAADMAVGEARAAWDGKNTAAAAVPNGSYTWTLTAAGADGPVPTSEVSALTGPITVSAPAGVIAFSAASSTTSAFGVTFDRDVAGANSTDVKLIPATGTSTTAPIATTVRCYSAAGAAVSCAAAARKVTVTPRSALVPGAAYRVGVNYGSTALVDAGNAPAKSWLSSSIRLLTADDQGMSQGWAVVNDTHAVGASYLREHRAGASFSSTFTGTSLRYWYVRGPDEGYARVLIDGVVKDSALDQYASARSFRNYRAYTGLTNATHTLTVLPLGSHRSGATDTFVTVDAMSTTASNCSTTTGCVYSPTGSLWATQNIPGGRGSVDDVAGAVLVRSFIGTGFDLYRMVGPGQGQLSVILDGHATTVNDYATANSVARYTRTGLTSAAHSLVVRVLHVTGKTGTAAYAVTIDRLVAR